MYVQDTKSMVFATGVVHQVDLPEGAEIESVTLGRGAYEVRYNADDTDPIESRKFLVVPTTRRMPTALMDPDIATEAGVPVTTIPVFVSDITSTRVAMSVYVLPGL